jgi:hypothetical protein
MPDIIIYPNRTLITGVPKIDFIGASGSGISLQIAQDGSINFMGTQGNLFSITDSLSGSLMAVTDIAGLPILEVFDDDRVIAGTFGTNALVVSGSGVGIGTNQIDRNYVLIVSGNSKFIGNIWSGTVNISDLFYPRSNPSGYVTTAQTGGYATKLELIATGRRSWDDAINLSGRLFATGALIAGVSGGLQAQISSNDSDITSLSNRITSTGQIGQANAFNLSGNLNATGRRAWDDAINLSGRLFATGALIASVSGGLEARINLSAANTLSSANTYSNGIGINLSGAIVATGRRAWDDATNLSGRLFTTGSTLDNKINSLSGYLPYVREVSHPITANYTIISNNGRIYCNNTNPITLTFPSAILNSGQLIKVKLINTGFVTFTGTFGQKFDGSDSYVANGQYNVYESHSNGANWYLW